VKKLHIYIATLLSLTFFIKCNTQGHIDKIAEQIALNIADNIDSSSLILLKEYDYGSRGDYDSWQKFSADTTRYSCSYKVRDDIVELIVFRPLNFIADFATTFNFDTSAFYQYHFFKRHDTIVKLLRVDNHGQDHISDTLVLSKQLFPNQDPFNKFAELTALQNKFGFIGTFSRRDIGDFIEFWITPQYKLTYLPDTSNIHPKFKKYWLADFSKGKSIKNHWSLQKVYE
jgi:hypothetical protein